MFYLVLSSTTLPLFYIFFLGYITLKFLKQKDLYEGFNKLVFLYFLIYIFFFLTLSTSLYHKMVPSLDFSYLSPLKLYFFLFILFFYLFYTLLNLTTLSWYTLNFLYFICIFFYIYFFFFFFFFKSHFEALCILEYINSVTILYILITVPKSTFNKSGSTKQKSVNYRYSTFFFFVPSLLNYFFLVFLVSIVLFLVYLYLLPNINFVFDFSFFKFIYLNSKFVGFFLFILILKLGVAPLHFWKLEIFESYRLVHILFFSSFYVLFFFFIFEFILLKISLLNWSSSYFLFNSIILLNTLFIFLNLNTILTFRQFLLVSSLLGMNLSFLSLLLSLYGSYPYFFFFTISYTFSIFSLYFYILLNVRSTTYISKLVHSKNFFTFYFFFLLPLLSLSGAAPTLSFCWKLHFLTFYGYLIPLISLFFYIFTIILSVVFYFQLLKTNLFIQNVSVNSPLQKSSKSYFIYINILFLNICLGLPFWFLISFFYCSVFHLNLFYFFELI